MALKARRSVCQFCLHQQAVAVFKTIPLNRRCSTNSYGEEVTEDVDVRKLLKDSRITVRTPLEADDVNLDVHSGEFKTSISAKAVLNLNKPPKSKNRFDLSQKSAFMFGGDSLHMDSVFVDRLSADPSVGEVFEEASSLLGYNVLDICLNGNSDLWNSLNYSDVVTFVTSMAEIAWIKKHRPLVHDGLIMTCGIGVGEISALVAAGALGMPQALKLVKDRRDALQQAVRLSESGLAVVYGSKKTKFAALCEHLKSFGELGGIEEPVCNVAIHLFACTKVIGGHMQCLKHLEALQKEYNIRKIVPLKSAIALHTPLMKAASEQFAVALNDVVFNDPKTWTASVYSGVTGARYQRDDFVKKNSYAAKMMLLKQLTSPVKWETIANRFSQRGRNDEYPNYYEIGSGALIKESFRQINAKAYTRCRKLKSFIEFVERREI
ncbi:probable malonyl-CoA-acyl carrier protein transacylase, mitochondrial isoform X2 [Symsagittifera roscoffensis]|uniref:probable malonyl-CoA-acyl carrier protein transacylase, mitochondrial isoform X2 n=1 Tax=Symsagittifera roscoffensis TaxID=84072 RepID=UPI00307B8604